MSAQVIDCSHEFKIRKRANHIMRIVRETGYENRVQLVLNSDEDSELGVSFTLFDKMTNQTLELDVSKYPQ